MKKILFSLILSMTVVSALQAFEQLTDLQDFEKRIQRGKVIVEFYAPWCQHCPAMEENLKKFDPSKRGITVYKVNVDKSREIVDKYGTPQVPALLYIENGKILDGYIGLKDLKALEKDYRHYFAKGLKG